MDPCSQHLVSGPKSGKGHNQRKGGPSPRVDPGLWVPNVGHLALQVRESRKQRSKGASDFIKCLFPIATVCASTGPWGNRHQSGGRKGPVGQRHCGWEAGSVARMAPNPVHTAPGQNPGPGTTLLPVQRKLTDSSPDALSLEPLANVLVYNHGPLV